MPRYSRYVDVPCASCGAVMHVTESAAANGRRFCSVACQHAAKKPGPPDTLLERFTSKVDTNGPGGCWVWRAARKELGYGRLRYDAQELRAHRVAYELHVGPIPEGMELDHLCRNPWCVNPAHLEPVTHRENMLRGAAPTVVAVNNGVCLRGHPLTPDNVTTYINVNGYPGVLCRRCARVRQDRKNARQRERRKQAGQ